jgi:hypothetical protein
VIVLDATHLESGGWRPGQAAVVAELRANGYDVELRPSAVRAAGDLDIELESLLLEEGVAGAVAIWKEDERGVVEVKTERSGLQRLTAPVADDALSRSRLALAVVDRVRLVDIPWLAAAPRSRPPPALRQRQSVAFLAVGIGVVNAGQGATWPWLSASGGVVLLPPFGVEGSIGLSLASSTSHTGSGKVSLRAEQAVAYAAFEPLAGRRLSFALGLGGGAVWVQGNAAAGPGFVGKDAVGRVALLGARARGSLRLGHALFTLTLEPGVLVPSVRLLGEGATLETFGRPWLSASAGFGWLL